MKILVLLFFVQMLILPAFAQSNTQVLPTEKGTLDVRLATEPEIPKPGEKTRLAIDFINPRTDKIQEHIDYKISVMKDGRNIFGPIPLTHTSEGSVKIPVEFPEDGKYVALVEIEGILFQPIPLETVSFNIAIGESQGGVLDPLPNNNGGCLIATATFGSELASQVQHLRELRDNTILETKSGTAFMNTFNNLYYTFSPTIADWERQNYVFKESVKLVITPMLSTLSILNYVDIDSEEKMIGYGIGIILLNIGIYAGIPTFAILKLYQFRRNDS